MKVYLRVARNPKAKTGYAVAANTKKSYRPLEDSSGRILPTVSFAIELEIAPKAFDAAAQVVAKLKVPEDRLEIAAEVIEV